MAKDKGSRGFSAADLDSTVADVAGKRCFYQLTDEEGGTDEAGGRKRAAVVARVYSDGRRDEQGRKLARVFVFEGSGFSKDAGLSSGREPGTWDIVQSGDLAS